MGVVIGPISQTPKERFASWFLLRQLREDVKWMSSEDPARFKTAIEKEKQTIAEEFKKYVTFN